LLRRNAQWRVPWRVDKALARHERQDVSRHSRWGLSAGALGPNFIVELPPEHAPRWYGERLRSNTERRSRRFGQRLFRPPRSGRGSLALA
jgi:hypothetical protein